LAAAIAAYGEAIRLGRRDIFYPQYLQSRAAAYLALKDIDRAIADYDEAIKVNPPNGGPRRLTEPKRAMRLSWLADAYWCRAKALLKKGDHVRAEQDLENASKLGKISFEHGEIA
jgi:tetratricopeptide (TPR) repeat protein